MRLFLDGEKTAVLQNLQIDIINLILSVNIPQSIRIDIGNTAVYLIGFGSCLLFKYRSVIEGSRSL